MKSLNFSLQFTNIINLNDYKSSDKLPGILIILNDKK